jgi:tetratricopeptide (TPR) repeat protein
MPSTLTQSEAAQLAQTIDMFEVITQSQPHDYQSLEILKEAYAKLGRDQEAVTTSKRIAQAYVEMGQLSSAILEYETILHRYPNDPDVQNALAQIESRASHFPMENSGDSTPAPKSRTDANGAGKSVPAVDDGRNVMYKLFVEGKVISAGDFDLCWTTPHPKSTEIPQPFVQVLAEKGILPVEKSLRMISDKSRAAFMSLASYEIEMDLARSFPRSVCRRWCVLPFDKMSKSVFVATVNPFNQQAAKELAEVTQTRLLWYLAPPADLLKMIRRAFR